MALTISNEFPVGTIAPEFNLLNTIDDKFYSLKELQGFTGTVILFICNHCPFVIHINDELVNIANEYKSKGINFIAISSNEIDNYPQDGPKFMKKVALKLDYSFPYLFDETQQVAKSYSAACTPDFYVFDANYIKDVLSRQIETPFRVASCVSKSLQMVRGKGLQAHIAALG